MSTNRQNTQHRFQHPQRNAALLKLVFLIWKSIFICATAELVLTSPLQLEWDAWIAEEYLQILFRDLQILPLCWSSPATSMLLSRNSVQGEGCSSTHWLMHHKMFFKNCLLHTNLYRCLCISSSWLIYCHMGTLGSKESLNKHHCLQFTQCFSICGLTEKN